MNITASTKEPHVSPICCGSCSGESSSHKDPESTTPQTEVVQESCPQPVSIHIDGCKDSERVNAGDVVLESLGRILQVDVTLKNICPNKRVALAVILTEVDDKGKEFPRGLKTLLIPAHHREGCRDVIVRCIKFVLPEELDVSGKSDGICNRRNFKVNSIANYVDTDFQCCDSVT